VSAGRQAFHTLSAANRPDELHGSPTAPWTEESVVLEEAPHADANIAKQTPNSAVSLQLVGGIPS
jgi:hypothetical protein